MTVAATATRGRHAMEMIVLTLTHKSVITVRISRRKRLFSCVTGGGVLCLFYAHPQNW